MNKIFIILLIFMTSCGYQSLYSGKNNKFVFEKIIQKGNKNINRRIISTLQLKEEYNSNFNNEIILDSTKNITITSKDSKGRAQSYRTSISLTLTISDGGKILKRKSIKKDFSYNKKDNKFDLVEYQLNVENNLISQIIDDLIIFLNL